MNLASFSPEVHEEEMSNPVSSADIASSIRERELEEEILRLKKDLDLAKRDREEKAFSIKSLIGQRARLKHLMEISAANLNKETSRQFSRMFALVHQTRSQFLQELFALAFSECRSGGFFVEFGACDGLHLSNSYLLETQFGWNGILSEPGKVWHEDLGRNRRAAIDTRCVWFETGHVLEFSESPTPGQSTISRFGDEKAEYTGKYAVQTVSLLDLLEKHNAPRYIDFLSMDTEGSEYDILRSFDFSKFRFGFISVEQHLTKHGSKITELLRNAGYELLFTGENPDLGPWARVSGFDNWYVRKEKLRLLEENRP